MRARRSCLSVPASEARFHARAALTQADEVFLDLEDSVAPAAKARARGMALEAMRILRFAAPVLAVRVNGINTEWFAEDVRAMALEGPDNLDCLIVPKVESAEQVRHVDSLLAHHEARAGRSRPLGLELQIESALGLENAAAIAAASPRAESLIFGPGDYAASMGMPQLAIGGDDPAIWDYPLQRIAVAARACGLQVIDGPVSRVRDTDLLRRSAERSARLGYDGKWAVHPDQVPIINQVYSPTLAEFERAGQILDAYAEAAGGPARGAVMVGEEMADEATRKLADALHRRGRAAGLGGTG